MIFILIVVVGLTAISFPNTSVFTPGVGASLSGKDLGGLECKAAKAEGVALEEKGSGRAANFSLLGSYECHRPIFAADERNPFVERLIAAQTRNAKRVASEIATRYRVAPKLDLSNQNFEALVVSVAGLDEPELEALVAQIYRNELTSSLGEGQVSRSSEPPTVGRYLRVNLRWVDDPDTMAQATMMTKDREGERVWREF